MMIKVLTTSNIHGPDQEVFIETNSIYEVKIIKREGVKNYIVKCYYQKSTADMFAGTSEECREYINEVFAVYNKDKSKNELIIE